MRLSANSFSTVDLLQNHSDRNNLRSTLSNYYERHSYSTPLPLVMFNIQRRVQRRQTDKQTTALSALTSGEGEAMANNVADSANKSAG